MRQWAGSSLVQVMACRLIALLSSGLPGTHFSEILTGILSLSFNKLHLKRSSAKWRPFCPGGDELRNGIRIHVIWLWRWCTYNLYTKNALTYTSQKHSTVETGKFRRIMSTSWLLSHWSVSQTWRTFVMGKFQCSIDRAVMKYPFNIN